MTKTEPEFEDDYETEAQARARVLGLPDTVMPVVDATGKPIVFLDVTPVETITEYGAFNQAEFFEPLFASGEIHTSLRTLVDEPLHVSNNLRSAVRFADIRNEERALADKMGLYGPVVVRTRVITRTHWQEVSYDDVDRVRGR